MTLDNSAIFQKELAISFKGNREYIYASDIFALIVSELKNLGLKKIEKVDFSVHDFSNKSIEFILYKDQSTIPDSENIAQLKFSAEGIDYFGIVKSSLSEIADRTEYEEEEIYNNTVIDKEENVIRLINNYSKYENLDVFTSMNKRLLYQTRPDIEGQWLSVRLQLEQLADLLEPRENYRIELKKIFSNKYSKSSLFNKDKKIGSLFFSLTKQN